MSAKAFPTDELGQQDAGNRIAQPKPCMRRIDHTNVGPELGIAVTWCTEQEGHRGQCSGPLPRVVEIESLTPKRKP